MLSNTNHHQWLLRTILFFLFLGVSFLPLLSGCSGNDLKFSTEYQAVFLDNGQVYFGKLEGAGSDYPILREVFYVQRQVDQDKKEAKALLVKRGSEWHGPDFMRLNARHIVLIEPVSPGSRVAQLIKEAKAVQSPPQ